MSPVPEEVIFLKPDISLLLSTITASDADTVPAVMPSSKLSSEAVEVTPSRMFSSAVVDVTPSRIFSSLAVAVTPSRMFSSAAVAVTAVLPSVNKPSATSSPVPFINFKAVEVKRAEMLFDPAFM